MDQTIKRDIEKAVRNNIAAADDNLYRANAAARGHDPSKRWGESGETLQQIINGYQADKDRWTRALSALAELCAEGDDRR